MGSTFADFPYNPTFAALSLFSFLLSPLSSHYQLVFNTSTIYLPFFPGFPARSWVQPIQMSGDDEKNVALPFIFELVLEDLPIGGLDVYLCNREKFHNQTGERKINFYSFEKFDKITALSFQGPCTSWYMIWAGVRWPYLLEVMSVLQIWQQMLSSKKRFV